MFLTVSVVIGLLIFGETFGNFLETVVVVIGQESVCVGMWSRKNPCAILLLLNSGVEMWMREYLTF